MSRIRGRTARLGLHGLALGTAAVVLAACGASGGVPGSSKTIYMTAMEYKGSTEVSKEPFPSAALPSGGSYGLKSPAGDPPKWEVNSYAWAPASLTVVEGDEVTLQIVGVNGAEHPSTIEGHVDSFTVKRGQLTTLKFTAGKPGLYLIECHTHRPGMTGQLVVLPKK